MWKNKVQPDYSEMTIWRMRIWCWIPKATDTHSEFLILIAFAGKLRLGVAAQFYVTRTLSPLLRPTFWGMILKMILNQGEGVNAALITLRIWSCSCSFLHGNPLTLRLHKTLQIPSLANRLAASQKRFRSTNLTHGCISFKINSF